MIKACRDCGNPVVGRASHAQLCVSCAEAAAARWKDDQAFYRSIEALTPKARAHAVYLRRKARTAAGAGPIV